MARVYVGNLDPGTEKEELKDAFEKHGRLADVWIARNPPGFSTVGCQTAGYQAVGC